MNDDGDLYPIDKDGNLREPTSQSDLLAQYLKDIAYWRERCHKAEDKVVAHEAVARGLQKALEELKATLPKQLTDALLQQGMAELIKDRVRLNWLLPRQYNHNTRASIDAELTKPNEAGDLPTQEQIAAMPIVSPNAGTERPRASEDRAGIHQKPSPLARGSLQ